MGGWVIHVPAVLDASLRSSALHGVEEWALVAAGADRIGSLAAMRADAAARLSATVLAPVTLGCVAYAATKFT